MVSSKGLASVEPWSYREGFNVDSWLLHDAFSHDNDLLAKALHNTVSPATPPPPPHTLSPFHSSTHTLSSNISGGSDQEGGGAKRKHNCILTGSQGKAMKRRSRASKKPQTTYITADPSNFRQMVQQVTGAKYEDDSTSLIFAPLVKPEPHRLVNTLFEKSTTVPMLDTSAFLSNHHHQESHDVAGLPPSVRANATVDVSGSAVEFDTYSTFPTLESWKVM